MRIRKLAPSVRVGGRWLCHLEDGTILRLGESEVVAFGLGTGKELDEAELSALTEAARAALLDTIPMKRLGTGADVAAAVAFFASEEAGYLTGQVLCVDGGMAV